MNLERITEEISSVALLGTLKQEVCQKNFDAGITGETHAKFAQPLTEFRA